MTPAREAHLARIKAEFSDRVDTKYRRGALEHRELLPELPPADLLDMAIDEALDQVTYLLTLKEVLYGTA